MLIIGVPGIGKSSTVAWIADQYKEENEIIILRFRDWEKDNLNNGLLKAICCTLKCQKKELEDKILVLDGFDEMKALDIREKIMDSFFNDIMDFENFKCIITSRTAYIKPSCFENIFELQEFDLEKIQRFYKTITGNGLGERNEIKSNISILGIPVILYMVIMSGIEIKKNTSKPEIYNRIFATKGGIFDKFCIEGIGYDKGMQVLRDKKNILKYLEFLEQVAIEMFIKKEPILLEGG